MTSRQRAEAHADLDELLRWADDPEIDRGKRIAMYMKLDARIDAGVSPTSKPPDGVHGQRMR